MAEVKNIKGNTVDDAWHHFTTDITWQESPGNYRAVIHTGTHSINLETVSSPGGNEEGWGFERTTLTAKLPAGNTFRFAIVPEDFLNRIGKFFGMQDVKTGFPEFDDNVLVQTNDEQRLKTLFNSPEVRETFQNLSGYSFHVEKADEGDGDQLQLLMQHAITNPSDLRRYFNVFNHVLTAIS